MSYTPSPIISFYSIADLTEDNTWGPLAIANFERLEQAIHATAEVPIAGIDVTLDDAPYVGTQSHKQTLYLYGTQSANVNLIVPDDTSVRVYRVLNNTTPTGGPWTVTVKTATGTGVALKHGEFAILYSNAINVISLFRTDEFMKNTADMDAKTHKITNLVDPTSAQDAATQNYVLTLLAAATQRFVSTDNGASSGPLVKLDRNSATPAANDLLGSVQYVGRSSTASEVVYAEILASILDPTNTNEDAVLHLNTMLAGVNAPRLYVADGIWTPNATGGNKGPGTINATGVYVNGLSVIRPVAYGPVNASGVSFEITDIANWHESLEIAINNLSNSVVGDILIEVGDSSTYYTSNYVGNSIGPGTNNYLWTSAIRLPLPSISNAVSGLIRLTKASASVDYSVAGACNQSTTNNTFLPTGRTPTVSLGITRIRFRVETGVFDSGSVKIVGL